jgi:phosphatidylserine decarboxylase
MFAKSVGITVSEAAKDIRQYTSINDFFTRDLKTECRPISAAALVNPSDGTIYALGHVYDNRIIQAKQKTYTVTDFLTAEIPDVFHSGSFVSIYLSPADCHRIYSPADVTVEKVVHVPGLLFPVREPFISKVDNLLCRNERMIVYMKHKTLGRMALVMVAAVNVSGISLDFDADFVETTCKKSAGIHTKNYDHLFLAKGSGLGAFHMGSTVVLLTEKPISFSKDIKINSSILYGSGLC